MYMDMVHTECEFECMFLLPSPGFMQAIQNLGMALITMMSGSVVDNMGYLWLEYFFIFWLAIALLGTLVIWVMDYYGSGE